MTLLGAEHGFLEVQPHDPTERRADREVVLLLHGLGGNKSDWSFPAWRSYHWDVDHDPADRESDNHLTPPLNPWDHLPELSPSDLRADVRCWAGVLTALGHTVINYSQDGPQEPVDVPLTQLEERIVPFIREQVLVDAASAIGLIPFPPLVSAVTRITGWLDESPGANQLLPDDPIFEELAMPDEVPDIDFATFGGTSVRYARVYSWHFTPGSYVPNFGDCPDIRFDWTLLPVEVPIASPVLDSLPDVVVDDEQDEGEGDGLVADDRAGLPGAPHQSLPINHAAALWDEELFSRVAELLGTPLNGDETVECVRGFIGNRRSLELHDPSRTRRNCQLDEIVAQWPFTRAEEAFDAGYDGCAFCMPEHHAR